MANKTSTSITEALKNADPKCPLEGKLDFDPDAVEIAGTVPKEARGLLVLEYEQLEYVKHLERQVSAAKMLAQNAKRLAVAIIVENDPAVLDRRGLVLAENWNYFTFGSSEERASIARLEKEFDTRLEREMKRKESGDDEGEGSENVLEELESLLGRDRHHSFGR